MIMIIKLMQEEVKFRRIQCKKYFSYLAEYSKFTILLSKSVLFPLTIQDRMMWLIKLHS